MFATAVTARDAFDQRPDCFIIRSQLVGHARQGGVERVRR
jgi:hypothetical protein